MYKFQHTYDNCTITVELNEQDVSIMDVMAAFRDFLLWCGFSEKTVDDALDGNNQND